MVTIQEAVQRAVDFAKETLGAARTVDLQLEEVESGTVRGEDAWLITLSMPNASKPTLRVLADPRDYKIFAVLKANGEVASIKIRELATS